MLNNQELNFFTYKLARIPLISSNLIKKQVTKYQKWLTNYTFNNLLNC